MPAPESSVLRPIDSSISDPDNYEIFTLSNAQVVYERNGKPASLLAAYADTPLRVTGRLEVPERHQLKCLVHRRKSPFAPVEIEIRNVMRFSYGQTEDGAIVIWALGEAGWFELRPAREYRDIFNGMLQAVEILYFVTDIYNEPRKRGGGPNAALIFQEYAEDSRFECTDPEEAAEIFYRHKDFLFMCFLSRAQGVPWSDTPLYQHFRRRFAAEREACKARIDGKHIATTNSRSLKSGKTSEPPQGKFKSKTEDKEKAKEAPKKNNNWWEAAAIYEFMLKAHAHGVLHIGNISGERLAKLIVKRYEIDEVETALNVILVHSANLCYMMENPLRNKKSRKFLLYEPIYKELRAGHGLSAAETRRAESVELRPRKDHSSMKDDISSDSSSSSEEGIETPRRRPSRRKKGTLSVLRPKSSKFSGKGKGIKQVKATGKAPNILPEFDSEDEGNQTDASDESNIELEIDTPTQAFSPGKRKRLLDDQPDDPFSNPRKRAASTSLDLSPSPATSSDTDSQTPDLTTSAALPLRWRTGTGGIAKPTAGSHYVPPIISSPLPTYTANAPGDSWLCTVDGCSQKVYGASTELGRMAIKEHMADHAKGRLREIGIVRSEEMKLRLPVDNLIKKIREMSERQQPLFPPSSTTKIQPSPIERKI